MANPVVDLLVVGKDAQSESEKALIPEVFDPDEKKYLYLNRASPEFPVVDADE